MRTLRLTVVLLALLAALLTGCARSASLRYERVLSSTFQPQQAPDERIALAFGLRDDGEAEVLLAAVAE